ncbi:MAG TPA: beta-ketoacyl-ACP synthase [Xanthobacteraceae bacterium]
MPAEAWITGIGIVSCLGEGPDAHWQGLLHPQPSADTARFAPYVIHPLAAIEFDKQIPKKGDQRQMEPWQRIGTYAAGLALDSGKVKGNAALLAHTDMIVAGGGGERDVEVDVAIMAGLRNAADPDAFINERLMSDLRPTLFLAQLSNLLAGNISIVHGVTGSSRTFMGEEAAGVDAVRVAVSRIAAGQSKLALVGGAHNAERKDLLLLYEFGSVALKEPYRPVWSRRASPGFALGSLGAFLVLEEREHAQARGAEPIARLSLVLSGRTGRDAGAVADALRRMWQPIAPRLEAGRYAILSGATGVEPATAEEQSFLAEHPEASIRATGSRIGHGMEAQFPMNIALAALAVRHGILFPPCAGSPVERAMEGALTQAVVTGVGHWRGEGMALVEAAH